MKNRIRVARTEDLQNITDNTILNTHVADGQPFYDKTGNKLYIGQKVDDSGNIRDAKISDFKDGTIEALSAHNAEVMVDSSTQQSLNEGTVNNPIYFKNGVPKSCSGEIIKEVTFTDSKNLFIFINSLEDPRNVIDVKIDLDANTCTSLTGEICNYNMINSSISINSNTLTIDKYVPSNYCFMSELINTNGVCQSFLSSVSESMSLAGMGDSQENIKLFLKIENHVSNTTSPMTILTEIRNDFIFTPSVSISQSGGTNSAIVRYRTLKSSQELTGTFKVRFTGDILSKIHFNIETIDNPFELSPNMTWIDFINSDYNSGEFSVEGNYIKYNTNYIYPRSGGNYKINKNSMILNNTKYSLKNS